MTKAVRDFGNAIKRPDAVALFYYSGHGVQYKGANYLIPAKSDIQDPDELAFAAINAEQVYAKMESSGDRTNIVILDACRNNPFPGAERASERGLAIVGSAPPQSLIVYATAPGKTAQDGSGRNGVFTAALLKHIADPGLDVELMVRKVREDVIAATGGAQVPWNNSSISGKGFFFAPKAELEAEPAKATVALAARPATAAAGKGLLTITSDPPGMRLVIDGADEVRTPINLELPAGAHSFEPLQSSIDNVWYAGQSLQWITVAAGGEMSVPVRIKPEMARLDLTMVPPGYKVSVHGEELGETPLGIVDIKAGVYDAKFEKKWEQTHTITGGVQPGAMAKISWGRSRDTAFPLQRQEIKLDGLSDSWDGVYPIYENDDPRPFLNEGKYGITAIYICRDDKYLYWRVDFKELDPLLKLPKSFGKAVTLQLDIWNEALKQNVSLSSYYNTDAKSIQYSTWVWYEASKSSKEAKAAAIAGKHNKNIFAGRVDWAWAERNIGEMANPRLTLVNSDGQWRWVEGTKVLLDLGWIDFSK